jgi:hypothetical protein
MLQWYEVLQIAQSLQLTEEDDALLWKLESDGLYSVKSLYAVINCRGVLPVHVHSVWNIKVPPKIHFFLWLLSHNRVLTRDNLVKRQNVDDLTCLFCNEPESCKHLFFDCSVATVLWNTVKNLTGVGHSQVSLDTLSDLWGHDKTHKVHNMLNASILWVLWLTRNDMCFNRAPWSGMQVLWRKSAYMLAQWSVLLQGAEKEKLQTMVSTLEMLARAPPLLIWPEPG